MRWYDRIIRTHTDVFENNYQAMLLGMQNERRVKAYVESSDQAQRE